MKPPVMSIFFGMVETESFGYFLRHLVGLSGSPLLFLSLKYELACSVSKPVESNRAMLLFSFVSLKYIFVKERRSEKLFVKYKCLHEYFEKVYCSCKEKSPVGFSF